jgi:hypothetical protein
LPGEDQGARPLKEQQMPCVRAGEEHGPRLTQRSLVPYVDARGETTTFEAWLSQQAGGSARSAGPRAA